MFTRWRINRLEKRLAWERDDEAFFRMAILGDSKDYGVDEVNQYLTAVKNCAKLEKKLRKLRAKLK